MPNNQTKIKPEHAVRQYLFFLDDPKSLIEQDRVDKAAQAVRDAIDPIDKLTALAELERVSNVDPTPLRAAFVENAKSWAEGVGVPVSAFRELKVPDDVLREAGFTVAPPKKSGGAQQRAKATPIEKIVSEVLKLKGPFLHAEIIDRIGGSPATVRKAIDELIGQGRVRNLGPVTDRSGARGRAPNQYEVIAEIQSLTPSE